MSSSIRFLRVRYSVSDSIGSTPPKVASVCASNAPATFEAGQLDP